MKLDVERFSCFYMSVTCRELSGEGRDKHKKESSDGRRHLPVLNGKDVLVTGTALVVDGGGVAG